MKFSLCGSSKDGWALDLKQRLWWYNKYGLEKTPETWDIIVDPLLSASRSTSPSTGPQHGVDEQVPNTSRTFCIFVDGPTSPFKMTLCEFFHLVSRFFTLYTLYTIEWTDGFFSYTPKKHQMWGTTKSGKLTEGLHMRERLNIELKELPIIQFWTVVLR